MGDDGKPTVADGQRDFEAWASLAARLLGRSAADRARIVRDAGLEAVWDSTHARWSKLLSAEMAAGRTERAERYGELCVAALTSETEETIAPDSSCEPTLVAEQGEAPPPPKSFVDALAPAGVDPQPPEPGQERTAGVELNDVRQQLLAAQAAAEWTVEQYAKYCVDRERGTVSTGPGGHDHGLTSSVVQQFVDDAWKRRFAEDPQLEARWSALVRDYRAQRDAGPPKPPPGPKRGP